MSHNYFYTLGWQAAKHGERRSWVEQYGADALKGYDDYWKSIGDQE